MQKPKYEAIAEEFNLDRGESDFENQQHTEIAGKILKGSKYYDPFAKGKTLLQIRYAKYKGKYGFDYFLSNNYRIFDDHIEKNFIYNSINELFAAIRKFGKAFILENYSNHKTMIKTLDINFSNQFQGYLSL